MADTQTFGEYTIPSLKGQTSEEEWKARVELAALYRLCEMFGWDDLSNTPITARIPGTEHYLVNPLGLIYEEITASSLVKIDIEGNKIDDSPFDITQDGWNPMKAVHMVRPDANVVIHMHEKYGIAVSLQERGLLALSQSSGFIQGIIGYHDFEGVINKEEAVAVLQASLGMDKLALILRNHGLLTLGADAAMAFSLMYQLWFSCKSQILAQSAGVPLIEIEENVIADMQLDILRQLEPGVNNNPWPGLLRKLDKIDPSYKL